MVIPPIVVLGIIVGTASSFWMMKSIRLPSHTPAVNPTVSIKTISVPAVSLSAGFTSAGPNIIAKVLFDKATFSDPITLDNYRLPEISIGQCKRSDDEIRGQVRFNVSRRPRKHNQRYVLTNSVLNRTFRHVPYGQSQHDGNPQILFRKDHQRVEATHRATSQIEKVENRNHHHGKRHLFAIRILQRFDEHTQRRIQRKRNSENLTKPAEKQTLVGLAFGYHHDRQSHGPNLLQHLENRAFLAVVAIGRLARDVLGALLLRLGQVVLGHRRLVQQEDVRENGQDNHNTAGGKKGLRHGSGALQTWTRATARWKVAKTNGSLPTICGGIINKMVICIMEIKTPLGRNALSRIFFFRFFFYCNSISSHYSINKTRMKVSTHNHRFLIFFFFFLSPCQAKYRSLH